VGGGSGCDVDLVASTMLWCMAYIPAILVMGCPGESLSRLLLNDNSGAKRHHGYSIKLKVPFKCSSAENSGLRHKVRHRLRVVIAWGRVQSQR
jgi:hypothetical protein